MAAYSVHARTIISGLTTGWFFVVGPLEYFLALERDPPNKALMAAVAFTLGCYIAVWAAAGFIDTFVRCLFKLSNSLISQQRLRRRLHKLTQCKFVA